MSQVIYQGTRYTACVMRDGSLVVTQNNKQRGKRLVAPEATKWIEAINTAVDTTEAHALCRAIVN